MGRRGRQSCAWSSSVTGGRQGASDRYISAVRFLQPSIPLRPPHHPRPPTPGTPDATSSASSRTALLLYSTPPELAQDVWPRRHNSLRHWLRPRYARSRPCLRIRTVRLPRYVNPIGHRRPPLERTGSSTPASYLPHAPSDPRRSNDPTPCFPVHSSALPPGAVGPSNPSCFPFLRNATMITQSNIHRRYGRLVRCDIPAPRSASSRL